jgi:Domain of unknown function (4846)
MSRLFIFSLLSFFTSCYWNNDKDISSAKKSGDQPDSLKVVSDINPPPGYKRMDMTKGSFGEWLRNISLKEDKHVYLYNGELKKNQRAQFAVMDIPLGKKDLQQCADALMRLRSEYFFNQKKYSAIEFKDNADKSYKWTGGSDRSGFEKYLETVFGMCGSASLEKQLNPVASMYEIQAGDVFIKGGFPGHAMMVVDVAVNNKGNKVFMLAQSYMPAQDIHIVKNPVNDTLSPWYEVNDEKEIITPQWIFSNNQLRRW